MLEFMEKQLNEIVEPVRDAQRPGFVYLRTGYINHFAVKNSYIDRTDLQNWLFSVFRRVSNGVVTTKGNLYHVEYSRRGYGCAHNFIAQRGNVDISFNFVPAFEFDFNKWPLSAPPSVPNDALYKYNWFAVPQSKGPSDNRTFMVCAPQWEYAAVEDKKNLKSVLRLMKGLRDAHNSELPHLSSYMLKTLILHQLPNCNWQRDLGSLLIEMWEKLVEHYQSGHLGYFMASDLNHFDPMKPTEFQQEKRAVMDLMDQLRRCSNSGSGVRALFKV